MKIFNLKHQTGENTSPNHSLPLVAGVMDNNATTKYTAVKPNRHSLAIFVPKICEPTKPTVTTGIKANHTLGMLNFEHTPSYDGLREPNKIALVANKFRHLCMVVESCHPFRVVANLLTKNTGGHTHA